VLYLTRLVAGSPHPTQNLEFFSLLDVKGSILFSVFSNKSYLSNYVERMYVINLVKSIILQTKCHYLAFS
jgi:hypothetical protein